MGGAAMLGLWVWCALAQAEELRSRVLPSDLGRVQVALEAELQRSMAELKLAEDGGPWYISYDLIDGWYSTARAEFGALLEDEVLPHRQLRVEVRTGDAALDSGNFQAFGEPDGVLMAGLPLEANPDAVQHFAWLATDAAYKQAVEHLSRKQAAMQGKSATPEPAPAMAPAEPTRTGPATPLPFQPDLVRERVVALSRVLAEYPALEGGQAAGRDWQGSRLLLSSEGMAVHQATGLTVIRVEAVLRHSDGSRLRDGRWWVARSADALPPLEQMEAEVRAMASWLVALEQAPVLEEYLGPVLFEGPAANELFRQLLAAELVGTPPPMEAPTFGEVPQGRASGRAGRRLLPAGWTVVDDPTLEGPAGSYRWDHEGVPAQRVVLVEDGVVQGLLHSRVPSGPESRSTGHGRSLGAGRREAMPAVVSVEPRRTRSEGALRRTALRLARQTGQDQVLVVRLLEPPAMAEDFEVYFTGDGPPSGLTAPYEAYLLGADGSVQPVRGLSFVGVDRRVLRDVVVSGRPEGWVNELDTQPGPMRFHLGAVGGIPVSWSAPPVVIGELELVGQQGGEQRELPRPPAPTSAGVDSSHTPQESP